MLRKIWVWIAVVMLCLVVAGCAAADDMTWTELQGLITNGESPVLVTLPSDVSAVGIYNAQPLQIPSGKTVTIDLNGHTLDRGLDSTVSNGYVINVQQGSILILQDSAGGGKVTGSFSSGIGCIMNVGELRLLGGSISGNHNAGVENLGTFILNGGSIENNNNYAIKNRAQGNDYHGSVTILSGTISGNSGAINNEPGATVRMDDGTLRGNGTWSEIYNYGTFVMNGGTITGHVGSDTVSAIIMCNQGSSFEMNGGSITGNSGTRGDVILCNSETTFTMTGGEISGNDTPQSTITSSGAVILTGGTITGNTSEGLVTFTENIQLEGNPVITNNGADGRQNVSLYNGTKINVTGAVGANARIGITIGSDFYQTKPFTSGLGAAATNNSRTFSSDNDTYVVAVRDGEAFLADPDTLEPVEDEITITFEANGGGGSMNPVVNPDEAWTVSDCRFTAPEGMVFAGWLLGDDGTEIISAGSVLTVTESITLKATWLEPKWGALQTLINTEGENTISYQLTGDVIANRTDDQLVIPAGKTVTIDLNGYRLDRNWMAAASSGYTDAIIVSQGATLIIRDTSSAQTGKLTGARCTNSYGNCIYNAGTLRLESGSITGNHDNVIKNVGAFTMTGGSISGNGHSSNDYVTIAVVNEATGKVTISGGIISDNASYGIYNYGTVTFSSGTIANNERGAVYTFQNGSMTMSGGTIEGNGETRSNAGAIANRGSLTITGGTIQNNTGAYAVYSDGTLTISGGTVKDNHAPGIYAANIALSGDVTFGNNVGKYDSGDILLSGSARITLADTLGANASIIVKTWSAPSQDNPVIVTEGFLDEDGAPRATIGQFINSRTGYYTILVDGEVAFSTEEVYLTDEVWVSVQTAIDNGSNSIILTEDAIARAVSSPLTIPAGKNVTIDLNGHTLNRNNFRTNTGYAILVVEGATLTIRDSSADQTGKITGESCTRNDWNSCIINFGTLVLESGSICDNTHYGIDNKGTLTVSGGSIARNRGGGILNSGLLTLTGGNITGNGVTSSVQVAVENLAGGEMIMRGGNITNNKAQGLWNFGTLTLTGGVISGNHQGVTVFSDAEMTMTGGTISGNGSQNKLGCGLSNYGTSTISGGSIRENTGMYTVDNSGSLTLAGGSITANQAGGIINQGQLTLAGAVTFGSNVYPGDNSTYKCDVFLPEGKVITLTDDFDPATPVIVNFIVNPNTTFTTAVVITDGFTGEDGPVVPASTFRSGQGYIRTMVDGEVAFASATYYQMDEPDFILPEDIRVIEAEAFAGIHARVIWIPKGTQEISIGSGAFADCETLEQIYIPANVTTIANDAFDADRSLVIFGDWSSAARTYAESHDNIYFVTKNH